MKSIVVTRLEYSDVTCQIVLFYSVDWTKAGISFIFPMVNLFRNYTLTERGLYGLIKLLSSHDGRSVDPKVEYYCLHKGYTSRQTNKKHMS